MVLAASAGRFSRPVENEAAAAQDATATISVSRRYI